MRQPNHCSRSLIIVSIADLVHANLMSSTATKYGPARTGSTDDDDASGGDDLFCGVDGFDTPPVAVVDVTVPPVVVVTRWCAFRSNAFVGGFQPVCFMRCHSTREARATSAIKARGKKPKLIILLDTWCDE